MLLITLSMCICLFLKGTQQTLTGFAMSANEKVIQNSKTAFLEYMKQMFTEMKFDDFNVVNYEMQNLQFTQIEIDESDVSIKIEGDRVKVDMKNVGGELSGHCQQKQLLGNYIRFDYQIKVDKGGIQSLHIEYGLTHQFVDGRTLPLVQVEQAIFEFDSSKININVQADDIVVSIATSFVKSLQSTFVVIMQEILNKAFPMMANNAIKSIQSSMKGQIHGGILQSLTDLLPKNNIQIPDSVFLSYAMADDNRAKIDNGKIQGFFEGDILGLDMKQFNFQQKDLKLGDLNLENNGSPLQFEISTKVINMISATILGQNQIAIDVSHQDIKNNSFPIDWTSTQLEGAIPELCEYVGYDMPLSSRFKNLGAPIFTLSKQELKVNFSMEVEVFDENFTSNFMTITFKDIIIDFTMKLENMRLITEWQQISMQQASINSAIVQNLEKHHADQHITDYFNWAFDLILPWVNHYHPQNINSIQIQKEIPGLLIINDMNLEVGENFFSFTMDPLFLVQKPIKSKKNDIGKNEQDNKDSEEQEKIKQHIKEMLEDGDDGDKQQNNQQIQIPQQTEQSENPQMNEDEYKKHIQEILNEDNGDGDQKFLQDDNKEKQVITNKQSEDPYMQMSEEEYKKHIQEILQD